MPTSGTYGSGLRVIDVSTPSAPVELGVFETPTTAAGIDVSAGYAYVAYYPVYEGALPRGLRVFDVLDPSTPVEVGFLGTPGDAKDVWVAGSYAFVAADDAGLRVIDVSMPSAPIEVGFIDTPGNAAGVAVARGYAFVADDGAGLRVIDVSTPSEPVEVGFVDTPGQAVNVAIAGSHAYLADSTALRVIDVSTPSTPVEVGSINVPGPEQGVAVSGRYAYLANGLTGLRVIDVSDPSAPFEVGSFDTPGKALGVAVSGGYVYLSELDTAPTFLRVIDVSEPSAPVEVGSFETATYSATAVEVSGGHVFVTGGEAGVYVFAECGEAQAQDGRECFIPAAAVAAGAEGAFFHRRRDQQHRAGRGAGLAAVAAPRRGQLRARRVRPNRARCRAEPALRQRAHRGLRPRARTRVGALKLVASTDSVIGMSRTYNIPTGETAGTFGQGLPAVRATDMIPADETRRIVFMSEDPDLRANLGCVNGTSSEITVDVSLFDDVGSFARDPALDCVLTPTSRSTGSSTTTHRSTATSTSPPPPRTPASTATARCSTTSPPTRPRSCRRCRPTHHLHPGRGAGSRCRKLLLPTDLDLSNAGSRLSPTTAGGCPAAPTTATRCAAALSRSLTRG